MPHCRLPDKKLQLKNQRFVQAGPDQPIKTTVRFNPKRPKVLLRKELIDGLVEAGIIVDPTWSSAHMEEVLIDRSSSR